jgi:DNA-binding transcriptional ArsR family regulator
MVARSATIAGAAPLFAALGDETRLRIVARLCAGGPQSIAAITAGVKVTRQAVTKHLRVLAEAGVARGARRGRESHWTLEPERLAAARRHLERISDEWTRRLGSLERRLDEMAQEEATTPRRRR